MTDDDDTDETDPGSLDSVPARNRPAVVDRPPLEWGVPLATMLASGAMAIRVLDGVARQEGPSAPTSLLPWLAFAGLALGAADLGRQLAARYRRGDEAAILTGLALAILAGAMLVGVALVALGADPLAGNPFGPRR